MTVSRRAPAGRITGLQTSGAHAFLGIPYGLPPVGPLRWRPPVKAPPAASIDATSPGPAPPQLSRPVQAWAPTTRNESMGEDCLNLDVYAPEAAGEGLPVIVHVFGGGFEGGSAGSRSIDGPAFVRSRDCILVRPNMRTGALGFLHLAGAFPELSETNRGMLDLVFALEWVRENIAAFGGDPGRVTLTGLSSGAFTVAALLGCPGTAGLFRAAWLMSGSASRILAPEAAEAVTREFLRRVDVRPGDIGALDRVPVQSILSAQEASVASHLGERNAPGGRTLGIVLDGTSLRQQPLAALCEGRGRDVGLVLGSTADEARAWYASGIMLEPDDAALVRTIRRFEPKNAIRELLSLRERYPGSGPAHLEERYLSEVIYRRPAAVSAQAQRRGGGVAATYTFAWAPTGPYAVLGAAHGFDEPFVYDTDAPIMWGAADSIGLRGEMSASLMRLALDGTPDWIGERRFGCGPRWSAQALTRNRISQPNA